MPLLLSFMIKKDIYFLENKTKQLTSKEMVSFGLILLRYPILSIEDALDEDDWNEWTL